MKRSGIYALTNTESGAVYVGRSVDLDKRERTHLWMLENNRHPNNHLQRAWNRGQRFTFSVLEYCQPEMCNDLEKFWIKKLGTMENGYNQCEGGLATTGYHLSEEAKRAISEKKKGMAQSPESVARRKASLKKHLETDQAFAEQYRKSRSDRMKGKAPHNKGKATPDSIRKKISEGGKGLKKPDSQREKLRALYSGEKALTAKLTAKEAAEIRYRVMLGEPRRSVWKDFPKVSIQAIHDIVRCRRWQSIPNDLEGLRRFLEREETHEDADQKPLREV